MTNFKKFNIFEKPDTRNYVHYHVTAHMTDAVKMDIICINKLVREGHTYKEIANIMSNDRKVKPAEVRRLHYGHAPNVYLSPAMKKEVAEIKANGYRETKHYDTYAITEQSHLDAEWDKSKPTKMVTGLFYNGTRNIIIEPDKCPDNMPIPIMMIKYKALSQRGQFENSNGIPDWAQRQNEQHQCQMYEFGTFECYFHHRYTSRQMCKVYAMYLGACCHINR